MGDSAALPVGCAEQTATSVRIEKDGFLDVDAENGSRNDGFRCSVNTYSD